MMRPLVVSNYSSASPIVSFKPPRYTVLKVKSNTNTDDKDVYFAFVVINGAILYYETNIDEYSKNSNKIQISFEELKSVATGSYKGNYQILRDISNAQVLVASSKRFKYFDIIGRHDSQVLTTNYGEVDLRTEVANCIALLEGYVGATPDSSGYLYLRGDNKTKWDRFYEILKTETMVILDGDFFVPGDKTWGIGIDGKFKYFELYYTLYSLYRYLYRSYLKNDYGYKKCNFDEKTFVKLKQSIVLLETYVADFYLCREDGYTKLDEGDSNAWRYLHDEAESEERVKFNVEDFFFQLYTLYKALSSEANCVRKYLTRIP